MSSVRPVTSASLLAALCLWAVPASAATPASSAPCSASLSALGSLACQLSHGLSPLAMGASVRVVALRSDRELPDPDALRERVRAAVASALGSPSTPGQRSASSVELSIEKRGGVLQVTAELRRSLGLWQRLRQREQAAQKHAFAEVPLDAELRALIPPPPLVARETLKLRAPERGIIAMACGPLGAEGGQQLVLLSRSSVRIGRIVNKAFVEGRRAMWSTLSPVAAVPLREPIASAEITPTGTVRVGLTDREHSLELSADLSVLQRFAGALPLPTTGCVARSGLGLQATPSACGARPQPAPSVVLDALAGHGGEWFGRELGGAKLVSSRPLPPRAVGAQLAAGDLDGDGNVELAFSEDTSDPTRDRVTLVTLAAGQLRTRFELSAPAVGALAMCQRPEGPGMAPLVVASGDELWLVR